MDIVKSRRVLLALAVVAALFNLGKAVHVDDTAYLEMARGIERHPLQPMSTLLNWENSAEPVYADINQPPLFPYLLAGTMRLFGESDLVLHGLTALFGPHWSSSSSTESRCAWARPGRCCSPRCSCSAPRFCLGRTS